MLALVLLAFASVSMAVENLPQSEVDEIVKGVESGDADAQFRLGMMYYNGQNVKQDYEQAEYWLKKSYEQGNVEAQFLLGGAYFEGQGVERDEAQAFKLMKQIAEKDPSTVKKVHGVEGQHGEKIYSSAEELVAVAQGFVGELYYTGKGVQKDVEQAEYWLNKSLEHGNENIKKEAQRTLEKIRAEKAKQSQTSTASTQPKPQSQPSASESVIEIGIEQLLREYRENKIAARRKYDGKRIRLSGFVHDIDEDNDKNIYISLSETKDDFDFGIRCYFNNSSVESVMNLKKGQSVTIEGTCRSGENMFGETRAQLQNSRVVSPNSSSTSQASERSSSQTSTQPTKTETEFERIQRLAQQGDANAQNKLGTMYEFGNGVAKDYNQAAEWYQKAAQQGLGLAQMNLAELYEKIEQNYAIAEYWYKEAANQGQAGAKTALERVQMKMGKEPTKTETAHTLQKPRTFDAAKGNAATFLSSIEDVAEKLMNTESYKTQDIEVMPADEYRNESETVYMRAWHNERYFMFCNYANSPRPVACFRTTSPEFTFAGGIKVGTSFNSIRDLFGDSWDADSNILYINVDSSEASIHIHDGRVDYIEYSYLGAEYTHQMMNLLYLYRDEIYSASITMETNSKLNVRSAPDTHSEVLFQVLKNNNLLFIENSSGVIGNGGNKWYRVRFVYDDSAKTISSVNEAYVYGKYINIMPLTYGERESLINAFN